MLCTGSKTPFQDISHLIKELTTHNYENFKSESDIA